MREALSSRFQRAVHKHYRREGSTHWQTLRSATIHCWLLCVAETEVKQCLDAPPLPLMDDPLHWCKCHAQAELLLSKMAQRHPSVPGRGVPAEEALSQIWACWPGSSKHNRSRTTRLLETCVQHRFRLTLHKLLRKCVCSLHCRFRLNF